MIWLATSSALRGKHCVMIIMGNESFVTFRVVEIYLDLFSRSAESTKRVTLGRQALLNYRQTVRDRIQRSTRPEAFIYHRLGDSNFTRQNRRKSFRRRAKARSYERLRVRSSKHSYSASKSCSLARAPNYSPLFSSHCSASKRRES